MQAVATHPKPRARVIDFGAPKHQTTSLNYDCGTANHLAPDMWQYPRKREEHRYRHVCFRTERLPALPQEACDMEPGGYGRTNRAYEQIIGNS